MVWSLEKRRLDYAENKEKYRQQRKLWRAAAIARGVSAQGYSNKAYHRNWNLVKSYGITFEEKCQMLKLQNFKCAICPTLLPDAAARDAHLDHDHKTNKVRGILCAHCNKMLGYAKDASEILIAGAVYLEKNCAN